MFDILLIKTIPVASSFKHVTVTHFKLHFNYIAIHCCKQEQTKQEKQHADTMKDIKS